MGIATADAIITANAVTTANAAADRVKWLHSTVLQQSHATTIIESVVWDGRKHGSAVPSSVNDELVAPMASSVQASKHLERVWCAAAATI